MGFLHRKLMPDSSNETSKHCEDYCGQICPDPCPDPCPVLCPPEYLNPPPSPISVPDSHTKAQSKLLIISITVLSAAFLLLCCFIYYVRRSRARSNARRRSQPETTETHDEFLDEDHGPILDHPIWYINTVGLQPSIINSIAVCKYKSGEGLVEGTECSVCLSEFEEDETLRLLPKCSHAFHIPCIDTRLRSHTNCPMCRAPIVSNTANGGPSSSDVNTGDSRVTEETQVIIVEDDAEQPEREIDGGASEIRVRTEQEDELAVENERKTGESSGAEDGIQPMRRSVSLDSLAASQISQAIANGFPEGSNGNSEIPMQRHTNSNVAKMKQYRAVVAKGYKDLTCL